MNLFYAARLALLVALVLAQLLLTPQIVRDTITSNISISPFTYNQFPLATIHQGTLQATTHCRLATLPRNKATLLLKRMLILMRTKATHQHNTEVRKDTQAPKGKDIPVHMDKDSNIPWLSLTTEGIKIKKRFR